MIKKSQKADLEKNPTDGKAFIEEYPIISKELI
jgi:hypothetical protein